nr:MAG TPA: hypothetical protein [Caudoviricetes sp.]
MAEVAQVITSLPNISRNLAHIINIYNINHI